MMLILWCLFLSLCVSFGLNGREQECYDGITSIILVNEPKSYSDAYTYCLDTYGTYLSSLYDSEVAPATAFMLKTGILNKAWIGLVNKHPGGWFEWVDGSCCDNIYGSCTDSNRWHDGHPLPNCDKHIGTNYVSIDHGGYINNDMDGQELLPFFCNCRLKEINSCEFSHPSLTSSPTIDQATQSPSTDPTQSPSSDPTRSPSSDPTQSPSSDPTQSPSTDPTQSPDPICVECDDYECDSVKLSTPFTVEETTELTKPIDDCKNKNIYFIMYYKKPNEYSFEKAAETKKSEIEASAGFNDATDCVVMLPFLKENEFKTIWTALSKVNAGTIKGGYIYCHASKGCKGKDGLEFPDGTLDQTEMGALAVLPWAKDSQLEIIACNSGVKGPRGWSPASAFNKRQKIRVCGENGYAYFSKSKNTYTKIPCDQADVKKEAKIYLRAYNRGSNAWFGAGGAITQKCEP